MIKTLYDMGLVLQAQEDFRSYFEPWQKAYGEGDQAKVIVVDVREKQLRNIYVEEYRNDRADKYLFRKAAGRATNLVPTFYYYLSKTVDEEKWEEEQTVNIQKVIKKTKASFKNNGHDFLSLEQLDDLGARLLAFSKELDSGCSYLITFKVEGQYLGEDADNRQLFYDEAYSKYYKKVYGNSQQENQLCALSGEWAKVYGFMDVLGFTVNDRAFMRNGFDQNESYKMFPVSEAAVVVLEGAMDFVKDRIEQRFQGDIKYLLLPQFIGRGEAKLKDEIIRSFINKCALNIDYEEQGLNGFITDTEQLIKEITEDEGLSSLVNYDLLFIVRNNSQLGLLLHLQDVLPSRLKYLLDQKQQTEQFYRKLTTVPKRDNKGGYQFRINLFKIKNFFSSEQGKKRVLSPVFYRLTEAIFCNQQLELPLVQGYILREIRKCYRRRRDNSYAFPSAVKEGFILLQFFYRLQLFHHQNTEIMSLSSTDTVALNAMDFIEQHDLFFSSEYKKGAFLFGCLIARLLYNQPGNAFLKDLNNLIIDKELINKKFPKLIDKLRKYKKEFRDMEAAASRYFACNDAVSKDEISMAVTLGMILQKEFDSKAKKAKAEETELAG